MFFSFTHEVHTPQAHGSNPQQIRFFIMPQKIKTPAPWRARSVD